MGDEEDDSNDDVSESGLRAAGTEENSHGGVSEFAGTEENSHGDVFEFAGTDKNSHGVVFEFVQHGEEGKSGAGDTNACSGQAPGKETAM